MGGSVLFTLILRGVLSPFAHPLFTSMTGIGAGIAANSRNAAARPFYVLGGYALAVILHALWNSSASLFDGGTFLIVYARRHGAAVRRDGDDRDLAAPPRAGRDRRAAPRLRAGGLDRAERDPAAVQPRRAPGLARGRAAALRAGGRAGRRPVPGGRHRPGVPARPHRARARSGRWPGSGTTRPSPRSSGRGGGPSGTRRRSRWRCATTAAGRRLEPTAAGAREPARSRSRREPAPAELAAPVTAQPTRAAGHRGGVGRTRRRGGRRGVGRGRAPRGGHLRGLARVGAPRRRAAARRAAAAARRGRGRGPTSSCSPCPTTCSPASSAASRRRGASARARSSCTPRARTGSPCSPPPPSTACCRSPCTR